MQLSFPKTPNMRSIILNVAHTRVSIFDLSEEFCPLWVTYHWFTSVLQRGKNLKRFYFHVKAKFTKQPQLSNVTFSVYRTHLCKTNDIFVKHQMVMGIIPIEIDKLCVSFCLGFIKNDPF